MTAEGRSFLADATRVLALTAEIIESVQQLSRQEAPALNVGYVADLFYNLLPNTLASFQHADNPSSAMRDYIDIVAAHGTSMR